MKSGEKRKKMREIESKSSYKTSRYRGRVTYMEIFTCISLFCSSNFLVAFRRNALAVSGISWKFWSFLFLGFYDEDGDYNINPSLYVFSWVFSDPFLSRSLSLNWGWLLLCKGTFKDSHHLLVLIRFGYCTFELSTW